MAPQIVRSIQLQVTCLLAPPADSAGESVEFGLQGQNQQLLVGTPQPDGSLCYRCTATIQPRIGSTVPNFAGPFVHGKPGARFLYLSLRRRGANDWLRRIKVPLESLTWEQIKGASQPARVLAVRVQGHRSGMVSLLEPGWTIEVDEGYVC